MTVNEPTGTDGDQNDVIAQLRRGISEIESKSADLVRRPPPNASESTGSGKTKRAASGQSGYPPIIYPGMPEGDDWMTNLPARYHDGERGFDRRLMGDLAAVGVPCYTVGELTRARTIPQGIPVFIDWLTHLEERIPGSETKHRKAIRAGLIRNLNDPAARGNQKAIDLLIAQLQRRPPLAGAASDYAARALARIATKSDFARIAELIEEGPAEVTKGPLIEYMGRVKTPEARDIALRYLDTEWTFFSLKALIQMKASGVRHRIEPYVHDANATVRKYAKRAVERLPE